MLENALPELETLGFKHLHKVLEGTTPEEREIGLRTRIQNTKENMPSHVGCVNCIRSIFCNHAALQGHTLCSHCHMLTQDRTFRDIIGRSARREEDGVELGKRT